MFSVFTRIYESESVFKCFFSQLFFSGDLCVPELVSSSVKGWPNNARYVYFYILKSISLNSTQNDKKIMEVIKGAKDDIMSLECESVLEAKKEQLLQCKGKTKSETC